MLFNNVYEEFLGCPER